MLSLFNPSVCSKRKIVNSATQIVFYVLYLHAAYLNMSLYVTLSLYSIVESLGSKDMQRRIVSELKKKFQVTGNMQTSSVNKIKQIIIF